MNFLEFRMLADVGLVVLIWITELITYPSFKRIKESELQEWHPIYTKRISFLVAPLMFVQASTGLLHLYSNTNIFSIMAFAFVLLTFYITFFIAVPLHNQIEKEMDIKGAVGALNAKNKYRTLVWTFIFLLGIAEYFTMHL